MSDGLSQLFPVILVASLTALGASLPLTNIARKFKLVDIPGSAPHKRHEQATPLSGGPILAVAVTLAYFMFQPSRLELTDGILIGSGLMVIWGLIDDRFDMPVAAKLAGQLAASAALIVLGIQVRFTQVAWADILLTILWVVGMTNAFNFVDSMDGLALGLASIATGFFMLATLDAGQLGLAALSAALLGAAVGMYVFNSSPAILFLGDSGSQLLGFALAAIGIAYVPAGAGLPQGVSWFTPILILGVPLFDAGLVVISRLRLRKPVYRAQNDHTYHRLVSLGLRPSRSVAVMHLAAIVLGLAATVALQLSVLLANVLFASVLAGGMAALIYLERTRPAEVARPELAVGESRPRS